MHRAFGNYASINFRVLISKCLMFNLISIFPSSSSKAQVASSPGIGSSRILTHSADLTLMPELIISIRLGIKWYGDLHVNRPLGSPSIRLMESQDDSLDPFRVVLASLDSLQLDRLGIRTRDFK